MRGSRAKQIKRELKERALLINPKGKGEIFKRDIRQAKKEYKFEQWLKRA